MLQTKVLSNLGLLHHLVKHRWTGERLGSFERKHLIMAKRWSGDNKHRLPAHKIEPYRLWFEFLKLTLTDKTLTVDEAFYKPWRVEQYQSFNQWWSDNWRELFSVDIGVYELVDNNRRSPTPYEIFVRIPLFQDPRTSASQVVGLVKNAVAVRHISKAPNGQFRLFSGSADDGTEIDPKIRFLKNLDKIRMYYYLYKYWLKNKQFPNRQRMQKTCLDYFLWAEDWNRKIRFKKDGSISKRKPHTVPEAIYYYSQYLLLRGERGKITRDEMMENDVVDNISNYQRQVSRYLVKAQKIARNVAKGQFPGGYE